MYFAEQEVERNNPGVVSNLRGQGTFLAIDLPTPKQQVLVALLLVLFLRTLFSE
jgi:hypothetical protein